MTVNIEIKRQKEGGGLGVKHQLTQHKKKQPTTIDCSQWLGFFPNSAKKKLYSIIRLFFSILGVFFFLATHFSVCYSF